MVGFTDSDVHRQSDTEPMEVISKGCGGFDCWERHAVKTLTATSEGLSYERRHGGTCATAYVTRDVLNRLLLKWTEVALPLWRPTTSDANRSTIAGDGL